MNVFHNKIMNMIAQKSKCKLHWSWYEWKLSLNMIYSTVTYICYITLWMLTEPCYAPFKLLFLQNIECSHTFPFINVISENLVVNQKNIPSWQSFFFSSSPFLLNKFVDIRKIKLWDIGEEILSLLAIWVHFWSKRD